MSTYADNEPFVRAREEIIDGLYRQLVGPGSEDDADPEHEVIHKPPHTRYHCGILYPHQGNVGESKDEQAEQEEVQAIQGEIARSQSNEGVENREASYRAPKDEPEDISDEISMANAPNPSSMGMTFFVRSQVDKLTVDVSFGTYKVNAKPKAPSDEGEFERIPHRLPVEVSFQHGDFVQGNPSLLDGTDLCLKAMRYQVSDNITSITVMLENTKHVTDTDTSDCTRYIFQPQISVKAEPNHFEFCSQEEMERVTAGQHSHTHSLLQEMLEDTVADPEEEELALLYRKHRRFASGMGVSADWDWDESSEQATRVYTSILPKYFVPPIQYVVRDSLKEKLSAAGLDANQICSMKFYSDLDETAWEEKSRYLQALVDDYKAWIDCLRKQSRTLPDHLKAAAERNLKHCAAAADRMNHGIELLRDEKQPATRHAFLLANRAMFMQRVQFTHRGDPDWLENMDFSSEDPELKVSWRPFQLAFILLSIGGLVESKSPEREYIDLIWFPTGGGKTEAYLGVSAFTIFYLRLTKGENYDAAGKQGVDILMRYTMRMLTTQQFDRASLLICACEYIRRESGDLGTVPITIGLWIGGDHVPNTCEKASDNLHNHQGSKLQVLTCPWCGAPLNTNGHGKGYHATNEEFWLHCTNPRCSFCGVRPDSDRTGVLPLQIIDEELYRNPPTLLIATIDKFAQMAWRGDVQHFFDGNGPTLILQDELHLISGPLGSIAGLYEMGIERLCEDQSGKNKPKIIAATATIRHAASQCRALYNREVRQFPPQGLDADDSYFAKADTSEEGKKNGRCYVGIMGSGHHKAGMEVRTITDLAEIAGSLKGDTELRDAFMTLTNYFSSIKELGQCITLVQDDVQNNIKGIHHWLHHDKFKKDEVKIGQILGDYSSKKGGHLMELTSRTSTQDLIQALEYLGQSHARDTERAVDMIFASNMLSVGIDVSRLNVMLMVCQPKLASEYIQASSRVGRKTPGVVFVLYDDLRSRDRSYYEQFRSFHESYYRFVEPTGATPFSPEARKRALHAAALVYLRHMDSLRENEDAKNFRKEDGGYINVCKNLKKSFADRCKEVETALGISERRAKEESRRVKEELDNFFIHWDEYARKTDLSYRGQGIPLLQDFEDYVSGGKNGHFPTLNSMRHVEQQIRGRIDDLREQED